MGSRISTRFELSSSQLRRFDKLSVQCCFWFGSELRAWRLPVMTNLHVSGICPSVPHGHFRRVPNDALVHHVLNRVMYERYKIIFHSIFESDSPSLSAM